MKLGKLYKIFVVSMAMVLGTNNATILGAQELILPVQELIASITPENTAILFDIHDVIMQKFIGPMLRAAASFPRKCEMVRGVSRELLAALYQLRKQKNVTGELFANVALQHNNEALSEFIIMLANVQSPIEGTVEIIKKLKARGFRIYVASNIGPRCFAQLQKMNPELFNRDIFELEFSQVASYEPGKVICKPDLLFFEKAKNKIIRHWLNSDSKLGLGKHSVGKEKELNMLFIDDSKKNIDAAIKAGLYAIHFKNAAQLEESLKQQFQIDL